MLLLAQPPGQTQAEGALDTLAGQGILGSLCVLLILALFFTVKALLKTKDDRVQDQKLMIESLLKVNEAAKTIALEVNKNSTELMHSLENQEKSFDAQASAFRQLHQEMIYRGGRS